LLRTAESVDIGQARGVAAFVASTFNGSRFPFGLLRCRAVDMIVSDDMLLCLDTLCRRRADLYRLVPDGEARERSMIHVQGPDGRDGGWMPDRRGAHRPVRARSCRSG
jgi:hypothetical protein